MLVGNQVMGLRGVGNRTITSYWQDKPRDTSSRAIMSEMLAAPCDHVTCKRKHRCNNHNSNKITIIMYGLPATIKWGWGGRI